MDTLTHEQALGLVEPFYNLFRSDKRDWEKGFAALSEDWKSWDGNDTHRTKAETRPFLEGLFALVPDMQVHNLQVIVEGEWIAVRSELTGTPQGEFFGVPYTGRSFHIMAVDFNRVRDGKMIELYHCENWAIAVAQLRGSWQGEGQRNLPA
jgi:predicted ester cyclase